MTELFVTGIYLTLVLISLLYTQGEYCDGGQGYFLPRLLQKISFGLVALIGDTSPF